MVKYIFLFAIFIAPFETILDSFFWTFLGERTEIFTPDWVRALDEILSVLLFVLLFYRMTQKQKIFYSTNVIYTVLIVITSISIIFSFIYNPIIIVASGLKWGIYIFLIGLFFYLSDDEKDFIHKNIITILIGFVLINFCMQILQLFTLAHYFGPTFFGLSQRTIGFFREPNTLALFNIISFYFIFTYMQKSVLKFILIYIILPTSIIITGSMTSILTFSLVLIVLNTNLNLKNFFYFFIFLIIIFYFIAPYIPSRPGLENSIFVRFDIILENLKFQNLFFSQMFGYGTNTAVLLNESAMVPDSTIASFLINNGTISTIALYLLFFRLFELQKAKLFIVCIVGMSLTNCIFSAYPMNLLIVFELSFLLSYFRNQGAKNEYTY